MADLEQIRLELTDKLVSIEMEGEEQLDQIQELKKANAELKIIPSSNASAGQKDFVIREQQ